MSSVTVVVPAGQVEELRRTLISLFSTEAEAVHQQAELCADDESVGTLLEHRAELLRLDALIDQLGWESPGPAEGARELSGDRRLLSAAAFGVLLELCERVSHACQRTWLGEAGVGEVRLAAEGVLELLPLVADLCRARHGLAGAGGCFLRDGA